MYNSRTRQTIDSDRRFASKSREERKEKGPRLMSYLLILSYSEF